MFRYYKYLLNTMKNKNKYKSSLFNKSRIIISCESLKELAQMSNLINNLNHSVRLFRIDKRKNIFQIGLYSYSYWWKIIELCKECEVNYKIK